MPPPELPDVAPLRTFDWTETDGPGAAVVAAVAAAADVDPIGLDPLYGTVDPDALRALLSPRGTRRRALTGSVSFEYAGYEVVLVGHGRGYLYEQDVDVPLVAARATGESEE